MTRGRWLGFRTGVEYCDASGKVRYDKRTAVTAANQRFKEDHVKLRIYECPYCHSWHLTSKPKLWYKKGKRR